MAKKILMVRPAPWDSDFKAYNIQEVGLGKAFCRLGYDYDYICMSTNPKPMWTFYEYEGCRGRYIEKPRRRVLRWAFNREVVSREFLKDYDSSKFKQLSMNASCFLNRMFLKVLMK